MRQKSEENASDKKLGRDGADKKNEKEQFPSYDKGIAVISVNVSKSALNNFHRITTTKNAIDLPTGPQRS